MDWVVGELKAATAAHISEIVVQVRSGVHQTRMVCSLAGSAIFPRPNIVVKAFLERFAASIFFPLFLFPAFALRADPTQILTVSTKP